MDLSGIVTDNLIFYRYNNGNPVLSKYTQTSSSGDRLLKMYNGIMSYIYCSGRGIMGGNSTSNSFTFTPCAANSYVRMHANAPGFIVGTQN